MIGEVEGPKLKSLKLNKNMEKEPEKWSEYPAYQEEDLEIKNKEELEEAKEVAGVSSHDEAMERFKINEIEHIEETLWGGGRSVKVLETNISNATISRGIVVDPQDAGEYITLYHFKSDQLEGDSWSFGKREGEDIWNNPDVKHVQLPEVEKDTLFLIDDQNLIEPGEDFWYDLDEKIKSNENMLQELRNPTEDDLKNDILERYCFPGGYLLKRRNTFTPATVSREGSVFRVKSEHWGKEMFLDYEEVKASYVEVRKWRISRLQFAESEYQKLIRIFKRKTH